MNETNEEQGQDLYPQLSFVVEKIQRQMAEGYSVIWNCKAVDELCFCMEDIFNHGLKERLLSWTSNNQVSFWSLAAKITCKKDIEDINRLRLKTDQEKCMAWIRQGLKENTLGSYLNVITQDEKLLREFYQPHAFLCNKEKAERTINLITYGISHLDFDISLTSNSKRLVESEASLIAYSVDVLSRLPGKEGLVNGFGSTPSSRSGHEHSARSGMDRNERTTRKKLKKKKKMKKAEVVMIAESVDSDETGSMTDKGSKAQNADVLTEGSEEESSSLNASDDPSSAKVKNNLSSAVALNTENDNISLTMELPLAETVLQRIIANKRRHVLPSDAATVSDEGEQGASGSVQDSVSSGSASLEKMATKSTVSDRNKSSDLRTGDATDGSIAAQQSLNCEVKVFESAVDVPEPDNDGQSRSSNSSEEVFEGEANRGLPQVVEENTLRADSHNDFPKYYAELAAFECGTPKLVDSISETERSREANVVYEEKDFNIVPGIHLCSRSSSGSLSGSGSFQSGSQRSSRRSTAESSYMKSSSLGSNAPPSSWPGDSNHNNPGGENLNIGSPSSESAFSDYEMFDELLGLEEDHFSPPEPFMGVSTSEELQHAIAACKDLINTTPNDPAEKKKLVGKLVQLRLKLQETQDSKSVGDSNAQKILGHTFVKEVERGRKINCDRCGKGIWMWQSLFTCSACKFHSHKQCLEVIRRACASRKVSVSTYNLDICPEPGLSSQQYKCAECRKLIGLTRGERSEARLCDYSGQYFCEECHWNDAVVIPARVVHNWDFSLYKVSRQSKQLLALMTDRPLLKIEKLNPDLFKFVVELREVKRLREEILIMKKYFVTCRQALESKLLLQLKERQHFVENSNVYSLQDLVDVNTGLLLPFLTKIHSLFLTHIKSDCQLCQGKGFVCEFCGKDEVIFAFDPHSSQCKQCRTVFHKICFRSGGCPKCERRQRRSQTN